MYSVNVWFTGGLLINDRQEIRTDYLIKSLHNCSPLEMKKHDKVPTSHYLDLKDVCVKKVPVNCHGLKVFSKLCNHIPSCSLLHVDCRHPS